MRLAVKVYLATSLVATLGTFAVGGSATYLAFEQERTALTDAINLDASEIDPNSIDALSDAIAVGIASDVPISIAYIDPSGLVSLIHNDGPNIVAKPSEQTLSAASTKVLELKGNLVRSLEMDNGGYLFMKASLKPAQSHLERNVWNLLAIYLGVLASMFLLVWLTLRRDLRSIRRINAAATLIAEGEIDAKLPNKTGNSEIEQLSRSLARMVGRLQEALESERQSKKAIETFIGDASHELRTPLTVIRGYSELLSSAESKDEAFAKNALAKIVTEVDRMNRLVEDLLLLARMGQQQKLDLEPVEVHNLALEAVESLNILDPKRRVDHTLEQVTLHTDRDLLVQFLNNAISNIHRYVPLKAKASITLSATKKFVTLAIEDGGPGLPAGAYKAGIRSFERFDASRSRESGGSGLGMSIMAGIAQALGGEVRLSKSTLGGLCVTLKLPR
jgi:two-component system OmpR family sensor kinase